MDGRITTAAGADAAAAAAAVAGAAARSPPNVLNATPGDIYRFNWNTPLMLSPHNPNIVWMGGNRLFRSDDRGNHWTASADLTSRSTAARWP